MSKKDFIPAVYTIGDETTADSVVMALVGSGGDGVVLLGNLVMELAARQGLFGIMVQSYGPQIRGGESAAIIRLACHEMNYEGDTTDLLLCFRVSDLKRFDAQVRLHPGSRVILEQHDDSEIPAWLGPARDNAYRFPFARREGDLEVEAEPKNMLGLGLVCRAMGWPLELARELLLERFGDRPEWLEKNMGGLERGYAAPDAPKLLPLRGEPSRKKLRIESGNEAVARGAMAAGVRFFAGYPITPSSEIMETLIDELPGVGGRVVQAEDEIASLGMVVGASFGGVPAMTATSGPGLSLMTEMLGLAGISDLPVVVVDCQRAGPATGMPSRTEQADLNHAVFGGHGDFPRVVLGVFDTVHARDVMFRAVHLSENYQIPVLVLSDAYIAQRRSIHEEWTAPAAPVLRRVWHEGDGPARFSLDGDGFVTPFRVPGTPGGEYLAAGLEHTASGAPSADTMVHQQMSARRFRKVDAIAVETRDWFRTVGRDDAPRGIIAWGSQYGMLRKLVRVHPEYRAFLPEILYPFPLEAFEEWRKGLEWSGVVELSYTSQFFHYLGGLTSMTGVHRVARAGGIPMSLIEFDQLVSEAK
ncbi:MAG: 2-oxoacid:acceptor oxidoreductase family protein [Candidatus Eisenbacteria bacterium]|nr:2-oxoacid:acceptor oxidoreductase family protein [Candidatus Eisenbacteria bacterium]